MPETTIRPDTDIRDDILVVLRQDDRIDATDIQVEVTGSRAVLSGTVPSYVSLVMAEADTTNIRGVAGVENRLAVRQQDDTVLPDDIDLRDSIVHHLRWNANIDADKIEVSVNRGHVILEGIVPSFWQKMMAESLTAGVRGVCGINNRLAVVPSESLSDEAVAAAVVTALERQVSLDLDMLNVEVENGAVRLAGSVVDAKSFRTAEEVAGAVRGVVSVENDLVIEGSRQD